MKRKFYKNLHWEVSKGYPDIYSILCTFAYHEIT